MLVVASVGSVPSRVFAPALGPSDAAEGLRMVARHIGEIGARHRFGRTATAGACGTGVYGGREEYYGKNLQQGFLVVCLMTRSVGKTVLLLAKSNSSIMSRFHSMSFVFAILSIAILVSAAN